MSLFANLSTFDLISTLCFSLAVLHTFLTKFFQKIALRYPEGSVAENVFHLLGEVEVVFGVWAALFLFTNLFFYPFAFVNTYLETRQFTEPFFVFVVMTICATKPILLVVRKCLLGAARVIEKAVRISQATATYISALVIGPLLGSFITEPAAMTVTAYFLLEYFYKRKLSDRLKFATIGLLFVNVSIGGTLTPYAAPPVLMVAKKWNWDFAFMLSNFGWKAALAILLSTLSIVFLHRSEFKKMDFTFSTKSGNKPLPAWIALVHLAFLACIILAAHYTVLFVGLFLLFLGVVQVTQEYQEELKMKESLLVAFFLGGLIVLGGPQKWWLEPLLSQLGQNSLYFGAILLTSITDNAALTYLGSQVENLSEALKYSLVAGSVVGGGLTVIANAPNPAGYSILNSSFGASGISPIQLLRAALLPTLIATFCFYLL